LLKRRYQKRIIVCTFYGLRDVKEIKINRNANSWLTLSLRFIILLRGWPPCLLIFPSCDNQLAIGLQHDMIPSPRCPRLGEHELYRGMLVTPPYLSVICSYFRHSAATNAPAWLHMTTIYNLLPPIGNKCRWLNTNFILS
jgi:hypothetical protein